MISKNSCEHADYKKQPADKYILLLPMAPVEAFCTILHWQVSLADMISGQSCEHAYYRSNQLIKTYFYWQWHRSQQSVQSVPSAISTSSSPKDQSMSMAQSSSKTDDRDDDSHSSSTSIEWSSGGGIGDGGIEQASIWHGSGPYPTFSTSPSFEAKGSAATAAAANSP